MAEMVAHFRRIRGRCRSLGFLGLVLIAAAVPSRAQADARSHVGTDPGASLTAALTRGMREVGDESGADVVDLTTGQVLYEHAGEVTRLPASVQKLYTTSAVLARFGPGAHLSTTLLGVGQRVGTSFDGTLYLRGGGDPTFGSADFDGGFYGTGSDPAELARTLAANGIRRLQGSIVADGNVFDAEKGTPATGGKPSIDVEGTLGGLTYDRGWLNASGTVYAADPALAAGRALAAALRAAGISLPRHPTVSAGRTPADALVLASTASPPMAALVRLTNAPSDNFIAETLLKDLGARFGGAGTTAAGAEIVRTTIASRFGLDPRLDDGSGLSRYDRTTPDQVVSLLGAQANDPAFTASLSITGDTGTLRHENRRTYAAGRCRGKTGTLYDVSNEVGYCRARDGHTIAYAFLMNGVDPDAAHPIQNAMQLALARYDG